MADKIPLKLTTGPNEIREFVAGDTVGTAHLPSTVVYTSGAQTLVDKTLDPTTVASRLLAVGATPARVLDLASTGTTSDYDAVKLTTQAAGNGAIVSAVSSATDADLRVQAKGSGNVYVQGNGIAVGTTGTQTLDNKTLTTPTISSTGFTNAQHAHLGATSGGALDATAIATGSFSQDRIADLANRQGFLGFGISSRVLKSNATAAGSNGTAAWAERARVVQVDCPAPADTAGYKLTSATVPVLPVNSTTQPFANFTIPTTTTSNFAFNTLPDCAKVKDPSGTSTGALNGKVVRFTLIGGAKCNAVARNLNIQFYLDSASGPALLMQNIQSASTLTIGTIYEFVVKGTLVFFGDGATNSGYYGALELAQLRDFGGAGIAMGNYLAAGFFSPSTINTTNADASKKIRVEMGFSNATAAAVNEYITLHAAIWEVLN
jgi:hypothetical protein